MHMLIEIMVRANGWKYDNGCWWNDQQCSRIIDHACRLGLAWRISVTQCGWTARGSYLACRYLERVRLTMAA